MQAKRSGQALFCNCAFPFGTPTLASSDRFAHDVVIHDKAFANRLHHRVGDLETTALVEANRGGIVPVDGQPESFGALFAAMSFNEGKDVSAPPAALFFWQDVDFAELGSGRFRIMHDGTIANRRPLLHYQEIFIALGNLLRDGCRALYRREHVLHLGLADDGDKMLRPYLSRKLGHRLDSRGRRNGNHIEIVTSQRAHQQKPGRLDDLNDDVVGNIFFLLPLLNHGEGGQNAVVDLKR